MRLKTKVFFGGSSKAHGGDWWPGAQERLYYCYPKIDGELLINYFGAILRIAWLGEFLTMLIAKVPAVVAAVLFMSSVSAQAMEFADRPLLIWKTSTTALTVRAMQTEEGLRRKVNNHDVILPVSSTWMKLGNPPRPISNLNRVWVEQLTFQNRPGRLSAEFSVVAKSFRMRFEYGPGETSSWLNSNATPIVMKFAHHLGQIGNLFPPLAAENIKFADHGFTSSLPKIEGPAGFCVGSMAPCGSLNSADRSRTGIFSATYDDERS
jgi:hypothetical protein